MTIQPTFLLSPETGPMLFADCPFCLAPLPMDLATGSMDCRDCAVHLELAPDPVAMPDLAAVAAGQTLLLVPAA